MVVRSWHADLKPGDQGTVIKRTRRGYAIEVTALFGDAFGNKNIETRRVFFAAKDLKHVR